MNRAARFLRRLGAVLALPAALAAQMTPDAPIRQFRLPMFDDDGHRVWDLRGAEARYVSQDRVELFTMELRVFRTDGSGNLQIEIESPQAVVHANRQEVEGPETLRIFNNDYEITGRDWTWRGRERHVTIRREVRVTFRAELTDILK